MSSNNPASHITPEMRTIGDPTPGIVREQAIMTDGMWAGLARTEAGMVSAWHHHGDHESTIYVVSGRLRMESGPGGSQVIDAKPGDFVFVPKQAIHREANPADHESNLIVVRAGQGPPVFNVEGPAES